MATFKLTKKMLIAAHNEIDESVGIEPPIKEDLPQDKYEKELYDTVLDLDLNKTEIGGFEKGTQDVIAALKEKYGKTKAEEEEEEEAPAAPAKKGGKKAPVIEEEEEEEEEPEEEEEEEDVPTLADAINACKKVSELTEIVNANKEFKKASKKLLAMKKVSDMKAAMLEIIAPDDEEEEEEAPAAPTKKGETKKDEKKSGGAVKKFTSAEYNRVDALVDALKAKPKTIDEWAKEGDKVLAAKGGTVQPNTRENKFTIGYFLKIAKHFDLGNIPKE